MYQNIALFGLFFSPLIIFLPAAFLLTAATRYTLYKLNLHKYLWKAAWFEVSIFICYLALINFFFNGVPS